MIKINLVNYDNDEIWAKEFVLQFDCFGIMGNTLIHGIY